VYKEVDGRDGSASTDDVVCYLSYGDGEELIRYVPGFFLLAVGGLYVIAGLFVTCFLGQGDPGYDQEERDGPLDKKNGATKMSDVAATNSASASASTSAAADPAADPAPTTNQNGVASNDNPFAI
jgi:hypothetical protein